MSTELLRRDDNWYVATARAMALSLMAVAVAVIVVSGLFVALHADQFRDRDHISVTQCLITKDGQRAVALWWSVPTTLQGWTHRLTMHQPDGGRLAAPLTWPEIVPSCIAPAATEDGIFVGGWDGSLYAVARLSPSEKPHLVGRHDDGVVELEASADGRYLISLSPAAICAWNLATNELLWQGCGRQIGCFRVHPDSTRLLCGMNDGSVVERDLHTGEPIRSLFANPPPWPVHDLDVSADGRLISVVHSNGEARLFMESATGSLPCPAPFCQIGWPRFAKFSACGTMLATTAAGDELDLAVWSVADWRQVATLRGHTGIILGAAFTADGRLCSWGQDATIRVWDVERGRALNVLSLAAPGQRTSRPWGMARRGGSAQASNAVPAGLFSPG